VGELKAVVNANRDGPWILKLAFCSDNDKNSLKEKFLMVKKVINHH
jgi:hypothetical protein